MIEAWKCIGLYLFPSWILLLIAARFCSPSLPQVAVVALAALLTTIWLFYGLARICLRPVAGERVQPIEASHLFGFVLTALLLVVLVAVQTGSTHDYVAYGQQWDIVLRGGDPWIGTDNAYGAAHNLLAGLYRIDRLLPKIFFAFLLVAVGAISAWAPIGAEDQSTAQQKMRLFAFLALSPFALITVGFYANNDILPAAAMVMALIGVVGFRRVAIRVLAGAALAVGDMSKFYPFILLPSLLCRRRRVDWAIVSGFFGALSLLGALAYGRWGSSIGIPLLFAGSRESKHLSPFNFARNVLNLDFDAYSVPLMAAAFVLITFLVYRINIGPLTGSILSFAVVLSCYKVGHQQFYLFFFLIAPYALRYWRSCSATMASRAATAFVVWLGFLNWYQLYYALTCGMWEGAARSFRYWGALLYLLLSAVLVLFVLWGFRTHESG